MNIFLVILLILKYFVEDLWVMLYVSFVLVLLLGFLVIIVVIDILDWEFLGLMYYKMVEENWGYCYFDLRLLCKCL